MLLEKNRQFSKADYAALRVQLRDKIIALYEGQIAAHAAMLDAIS